MMFSESYENRFYENLMKLVPRFQPRSSGIVIVNKHKLTAEDCDCRLCPDRRRGKCIHKHCPCFGERLGVGSVSVRELMFETLYEIRDVMFQRRLLEMIDERSKDGMVFLNEAHESRFTEAIEMKDQTDRKLMATLFLLTANARLWHCTRFFISGNSLDFDRMRPTGLNELGYTVFCAAKDLYTGSKHFSVSDLADRDLISPKQFSLICFAMAIRRFGLDALKTKEALK